MQWQTTLICQGLNTTNMDFLPLQTPPPAQTPVQINSWREWTRRSRLLRPCTSFLAARSHRGKSVSWRSHTDFFMLQYPSTSLREHRANAFVLVNGFKRQNTIIIRALHALLRCPSLFPSEVIVVLNFVVTIFFIPFTGLAHIIMSLNHVVLSYAFF